MTPETSLREAACISEEGTVPQTFTHLKLPIRRDTWEVVIRDSKTLTSKIMKTAGLHSLIRRTILPVSTVELHRRCGPLVSGLRLTLGSTQKAFATGTNLTPQPATESLFRGERGGRPTGLEPATARTTIWSSTIELRPPSLFGVGECNGKIGWEKLEFQEGQPFSGGEAQGWGCDHFKMPFRKWI